MGLEKLKKPTLEKKFYGYLSITQGVPMLLYNFKFHQELLKMWNILISSFFNILLLILLDMWPGFCFLYWVHFVGFGNMIVGRSCVGCPKLCMWCPKLCSCNNDIAKIYMKFLVNMIFLRTGAIWQELFHPPTNTPTLSKVISFKFWLLEMNYRLMCKFQ